MGTLLSSENRENLIEHVKEIFKFADFDDSRQQISALAHANYSDCIENLTEEQRANLKEVVNHVEYSLNMHQELLESKVKNIKDQESVARHKAIAKEALEIEILAVFNLWPVF